MSPAAPSGTRLDPAVSRELWSSFVSVVRSYTAAHSVNGTRQAVLEVSSDRLLVRAGERLLTIVFDGEHGTMTREDGRTLPFTLDEHGRITSEGATEEMDMVAERLAREILR